MARKLSIVLLAAAAGLLLSGDERGSEERLSFQTSGPWSPRTNLNADVAMVYGIGPRMPANIETWRKRGYAIHVMTGVAWGEYQDYLYGRFDGQNHWDQAQTQADGKQILHGPDVPYVSPLRPPRLVSKRPHRGQPESRLGRLPHQLGEYAHRIAAPA